MGAPSTRPQFRIFSDRSASIDVANSGELSSTSFTTLTLFVNYSKGDEAYTDIWVNGLSRAGGREFPTGLWVFLRSSQRRRISVDVGGFNRYIVYICSMHNGPIPAPGEITIDATLSRDMPTDQFYGRKAASRDGRDLHGYVNDKTGIGTNTVLTDATIVHNLKDGERVYIDKMVWGMTTANDLAHFELGYTDQPSGAGTFTPLTGHRHIVTPVPSAGFQDQSEDFVNLRQVSYSGGARCITFRITTNDADANISAEWYGWREKEA